MTIFLRDFSLFALKKDMHSGVPYIYVTLAGYDEVSHHSGVERPDTLEVLRKLDREFVIWKKSQETLQENMSSLCYLTMDILRVPHSKTAMGKVLKIRSSLRQWLRK